MIPNKNQELKKTCWSQANVASVQIHGLWYPCDHPYQNKTKWSREARKSVNKINQTYMLG